MVIVRPETLNHTPATKKESYYTGLGFDMGMIDLIGCKANSTKLSFMLSFVYHHDK